MGDAFFSAVGLESADEAGIRQFARAVGVSRQMLAYYNSENTLPSGRDLEAILRGTRLSKAELMLRMGHIDARLLESIQNRSKEIARLLAPDLPTNASACDVIPPVYTTELGKLYRADCMAVMRQMESDSVDMVFADPPFNLKKLYPSGIDDDLREEQYVRWCEEWMEECIRILAPGGSFFLWNLPRWNATFSSFLNRRLTFRHWIAVDIKYSLPVQGRLYPSHYSLLYYCKGSKPKTFHPDRLPMQVCPECAADLRDYGGYKDKMNPSGINLTDVWYDIPPVRHSKYKKRNGANELSVRLLDRVIEMASDPGDLVFDPFGGSGTTFAVSELKKRRWCGTEIGPVDGIVQRLEEIADEAEYLSAVRENYNALFTARTLRIRGRRGLWTHESVRKPKMPNSAAAPEDSRHQRVEQAMLLERAKVPYSA
jgi:site-specific DNA-methyltransferase (adenine-specific)